LSLDKYNHEMNLTNTLEKRYDSYIPSGPGVILTADNGYLLFQ
jgi:hypothetical protein